MGHIVVTKRNILNVITICVLQIVLAIMCMMFSFIVKFSWGVFLIPCIQTIVLMIINNQNKELTVKNFLYSLFSTIVLFAPLIIYMVAYKSLLGFWLIIIMYFLCFGISDIICIVILKITNAFNR